MERGGGGGGGGCLFWIMLLVGCDSWKISCQLLPMNMKIAKFFSLSLERFQLQNERTFDLQSSA